MPTTPGASRPSRLQSINYKQSSTMPPTRQSSKPKPAPKRSASAPTPPAKRSGPGSTPRRSATQNYYSSGSGGARQAQVQRSRSTPHQRASGSGSGSKPSSRSDSHHRSAQPPPHSHSRTTQHVHRSQQRTSSGRPVYVVCNRQHVDDGFYAKCQRVLRRFVKWDQ